MKRLLALGLLWSGTALAQAPLGQGFTGTANQFTSTKTSGHGFRLKQGAGICFNSTTCSAEIYYDGTDLILDVPSSKGFRLRVNDTNVFTVSSAGAVVASANITGTNLITTSGSLGAVYSDSGGFVANGSDRGAELSGKKADSAGNIGVKLQNQTDMTAGSDRYITSFLRGLNANKTAVRVNTAGGVQLNVERVSAPTCDSIEEAGTFHYVHSASLSGDILQMCMKGTDDAYNWETVFTAP